MRFPSIKDVAEVLRGIAWNTELEVPESDDEDDDDSDLYIEVRLQVSDDGSWRVWHGLPDYDTDHRGYWGASAVFPFATKKDCVDVARVLKLEAQDDYAQRPEGD